MTEKLGSGFQNFRHFAIPYFIYVFLFYLAPPPFKSGLENLFPEAGNQTISLKTLMLPFVVAAVAHYLLINLRLILNKPWYDRVNEFILTRAREETGKNIPSFQNMRPAFYKIIDSDASLTVLSERIKFNGLYWMGCADLRLASLLLMVCWSIGGYIAYYFSFDPQPWIWSGLLMTCLAIASLLGSEITTRRHIKLIADQLNQFFAHHKEQFIALLPG
ncbi:MAG TPA: hypothetical protein VNQ34_04080 [Xanthobacteraceae bacterium]|jgi:hypothetical protein|nr:hypothetical protein [Xanthobacteraceae bacterium]